MHSTALRAGAKQLLLLHFHVGLQPFYLPGGLPCSHWPGRNKSLLPPGRSALQPKAGTKTNTTNGISCFSRHSTTHRVGPIQLHLFYFHVGVAPVQPPWRSALQPLAGTKTKTLQPPSRSALQPIGRDETKTTVGNLLLQQALNHLHVGAKR